MLFNEALSELLRHNRITAGFTVFAGDFNIDIGENDHPDTTVTFVNELRSYHFIPAITIPTRITQNSATTIDHIWFNSTVQCKAGVITYDITDHYPAFLIIPQVFHNPSVFVEQSFRCHSAVSIANFQNEISNVVSNFSLYDNLDINTKWSLFFDKLIAAYNSSCPLKYKRVSSKRATTPWLTDALLRSIEEKHRLHKLSVRNPGQLTRYRRYRNVLCGLFGRLNTHTLIVNSIDAEIT